MLTETISMIPISTLRRLFQRVDVPSPESFAAKVIRLSPLIIPLLFYIGYLHKYIFLILIEVDISSYIGFEELIIMSLSELASSATYLIIIIAATLGIMKATDSFVLWLSARFSWIRMVVMILFFAAVAIAAVQLFNLVVKLEAKTAYDAGAFVLFFPIVFGIWCLYILITLSKLRTITDQNDWRLAVIIILLFGNSLLQPHLKLNRLLAIEELIDENEALKKENYILLKNDKKIDNILIYSETERFIFYYGPKKRIVAIAKANVKECSRTTIDSTVVKTILSIDNAVMGLVDTAPEKTLR